MDNSKNDKYYLERIIKDIVFIIEQCSNMTLEEYENNELVNSSIVFKFVQISENMTHLSQEIVMKNSDIPWTKIRGLRNKIVHDYGNIIHYVIYNTINNDLPPLLNRLKDLLNRIE